MRDLISILIGDEGRCKLENRNKTNDQLFTDYFNLLLTSHSDRYLYEAKRTLNKFHAFLGEFPPTIDLGVDFFTRFKDLKPNSRARYAFTMSSFFNGTAERNFLSKFARLRSCHSMSKMLISNV